jgi:hypothetical protein
MRGLVYCTGPTKTDSALMRRNGTSASVQERLFVTNAEGIHIGRRAPSGTLMRRMGVKTPAWPAPTRPVPGNSIHYLLRRVQCRWGALDSPPFPRPGALCISAGGCRSVGADPVTLGDATPGRLRRRSSAT